MIPDQGPQKDIADQRRRIVPLARGRVLEMGMGLNLPFYNPDRIEFVWGLDPSVIRWQDSLNPLWMKVSGGCHLNRSISGLIQNSGFHINHMDSRYMSPIRLISYNYLGSASPV
ncbi:MAG: hypothetical protein NDI81_16310 [Desulfobacula sp.]|nr:hypothetical protein [Desulfobacula sp.]